jgi:hypothetical protein
VHATLRDRHDACITLPGAAPVGLGLTSDPIFAVPGSRSRDGVDVVAGAATSPSGIGGVTSHLAYAEGLIGLRTALGHSLGRSAPAPG